MMSPSTCFTPRATIASANSASTFSGAPSCSASFSKGNLRLERFGSPAPASTRSPLTRPSGDTLPVASTVVVKVKSGPSVASARTVVKSFMFDAGEKYSCAFLANNISPVASSVIRIPHSALPAFSAENAGKAEWGILITDEATGEILFARNAQEYFSPASNMKLFTTVLALATLGPDFTFTTTVETTGNVSPDGRVSGDLVLAGAGDPNLSNRRFPFEKEAEHDGAPEKVLAEFADAIVARGVKQVDGDIIADDSLFSLERYPSGWEIDDMVWSYGAAVSALSVNDNIVTLTLNPSEEEGGGVSYTVEPWSEEIEVENNVVTGPAGLKPELALLREPGSRRVVVRGTLPARSAPHPLVLAIEEPAEHAAHLLKHLLEARGVQINGSARARHWP